MKAASGKELQGASSSTRRFKFSDGLEAWGTPCGCFHSSKAPKHVVFGVVSVRLIVTGSKGVPLFPQLYLRFLEGGFLSESSLGPLKCLEQHPDPL